LVEAFDLETLEYHIQHTCTECQLWKKGRLMDWHALRQTRQVEDLIVYTRQPKRIAQAAGVLAAHMEISEAARKEGVEPRVAAMASLCHALGLLICENIDPTVAITAALRDNPAFQANANVVEGTKSVN
jgi:hypothetical protein